MADMGYTHIGNPSVMPARQCIRWSYSGHLRKSRRYAAVWASFLRLERRRLVG
jgi:hypothetical protein